MSRGGAAFDRRAVLSLLAAAAPAAITGACARPPDAKLELTLRAFFQDAHGVDLTPDDVQMLLGYLKGLPKLTPPAATQPSLGLDVDAD